MGLTDKIKSSVKEIQNKPEKEKVKIIWVLAILVVAIIAAVWFGFARGNGASGGGAKNQTFEDLKKEIKERFNDKFSGKLKIPKIETPKITPSPDSTGAKEN